MVPLDGRGRCPLACGGPTAAFCLADTLEPESASPVDGVAFLVAAWIVHEESTDFQRYECEYEDGTFTPLRLY